MATSGTVATTTISCAEIFDHAFRRLRLLPEQVTNQHISTARKLLWMVLSALNQRGIALWVVETQLIGLREMQGAVPTTAGNLDVYEVNLRQLTRIDGVPVSNSGTATYAYDQDLSTPCTQVVANGHIDIMFTTASSLTTIGFLPTVSGTWSYDLYWQDPDTLVWNLFQSYTNVAVTANYWKWYAFGLVPNAGGFRLQATNGTTLKVWEVVCGNNLSDIPMGVMDRTTYNQMPNKYFTGRPTTYFYDRKQTTPVLHIWPTASAAYVQQFYIAATFQRQLQDVGTMAQNIEVPDRWYLAVIAELSRNLAREVKECDPTQYPDLDMDAERLLRQAWDSETDGAPARWIPNIGAYTA